MRDSAGFPGTFRRVALSFFLGAQGGSARQTGMNVLTFFGRRLRRELFHHAERATQTEPKSQRVGIELSP